MDYSTCLYELVQDFYLKLCEGDLNCDPNYVLEECFPPIPEHLSEFIYRSFTREDIKYALFKMDGPWNAPGPDGVIQLFIKSYGRR